MARAVPLLTETERRCLERYVDLVVEVVGGELEEIRLFGSVARGESWPLGMPIHSDADVLIVTSRALDDETVRALIDATYPAVPRGRATDRPAVPDARPARASRGRTRGALR